MTTVIRKLPERITQILEQEKLSTDHIIYYDAQHGWICKQRDDTLLNSPSKSIEEKADTIINDNSRPLDKLGPFGTKPTNISINITKNSDMYRVTLDESLTKLNITDGFGQHAPIAPVTLTGKARDVAYIPQEATHFCWIYPPTGITQLKNKKKARIEREIANGNSEYTFLSLGGFAYFRYEQNSFRMLQANCLVQADNGLTFQGPFPWRSAYTAGLARQGRFQDVTISSLLELGIKYYCFINPNEKLTSSKTNNSDWIPAPNGGFIYLYGSNQEPHAYDRYFCVTDRPLKEQISTNVMPFSLIHKRKQSQRVSSKTIPSEGSSPSPSPDLSRNFSCSICLERTVRCIFMPCKHMCTCSECAQEIRQRLNSVCPICRQVFNEVWDVFL